MHNTTKHSPKPDAREAISIMILIEMKTTLISIKEGLSKPKAGVNMI